MQRAAGDALLRPTGVLSRHRATNTQLARDLQVGVLNAELERAWATINEAVARDEAHKRRVSKWVQYSTSSLCAA
jgi:hypothetical protein